MFYTLFCSCDYHFNRIQDRLANFNIKKPSNNIPYPWDYFCKLLRPNSLTFILFFAIFFGGYLFSLVSAQSSFNIEWDQGDHAEITKNSASQTGYEDYLAIVSFTEVNATNSFSFIIEESKNDAFPSRFESPIQTDAISTEKFPGMETAFEQGLSFGSWFISSHHAGSNQMYILFRPNANAINLLTFQDSVSSELTIVMNESIDGETVESARNSIAVQIKGSNFEIQSYLDTVEPGGNNVVSIFPIDSPIMEGEDAMFQVFVSNNAVEDLQINLEVSQLGNYIKGQLPESVSVSTGESSAELRVPTIENSIYDSPGTITVELTEGNGYDVTSGLHNTASVKVFDNDGNSGISVIATESVILEGQTAQFQLISDRTFAEDLAISYNVIKRGDFLSASISDSITLERFKQSTLLNIATQEDDNLNSAGSLTINIQENEQYRVARVPFNSAVITVLDNNIPELSIFPVGTGEVSEGQDIQFRITSSTALTNNTLINIDLQFAQEDGLIRSTKFLLMSGETEGIVSIQTEDDLELELDEDVTATLVPGNGYLVTNTSNNSATSVISGDEIPVVEVTSNSNTVTEGETIEFVISSHYPLESELAVEYVVNQTGDFVSIDQLTAVELTPTQLSQTIEFEVVEDDVVIPDGKVIATLSSSELYQFNSSGKSAVVTVLDNDTPQGVAIYSKNSFVTEGEIISFELVTSTPFSNDQTIPISINQTGEFLPASLPDQITFEANQTTMQLKLETIDDQVAEDTGGVTVTIEPGNNYELTEFVSGVVSILDNDSGSGLSITALEESINEGETATFLIRTSELFTTDKIINLQINQVGEFLRAELPTTLFFPAYQSEIRLELATEDDLQFELKGQLRVEILPSSSYQIASTSYNSASIAILDNDPKPVLSIHNISATSITEGESAQFRITTTESLDFDLPVSLTVTGDIEEYLASDIIKPILPSGQTAVELEIETVQDEVDEIDGTIEVAIQVNENYNLAVTPENIAGVIVLDDDLPVISLESTTILATAGDTFLFKVHSSTEVEDDLNITLTVSETKEFISEQDYTNITIPAGNKTGELTIQTITEDLFYGIGVIHIEIQASTNYRLAGDQSTLLTTVMIEDNVIPTGISISAETNQIYENHASGVVRFHLFSDEESTTDRTIDLEISSTGEFVDLDSNTIQHIIPAGESKSVLEIPLFNDTVDEIAGQLEVLIAPSANYTPAASPNNTASTAIVDDDLSIVSISLAGTESSITEGEDAVVQLSVPFVLSDPLDIKLATELSAEFGEVSPTQTARIESGTNQVEVIISTIADNSYEPHGVASIELLPDENYILSQHTDPRIEFIVLDDDESNSGISIIDIEDEIVEGELANFEIRTAATVSTPTLINVQINETGSFLRQNYLESITLLPNETYKRIQVATIDDEDYEDDGEIHAEILPNANLQLVETNYRASIMVLDNDLPTVSITSNLNIFEGDDAYYMLEFSEPLLDPITVAVSISVTGAFDIEAGSHLVEFDAGDAIKFLVIETEQDDQTETDGIITATIDSSENYLVSATNSTAETNIFDVQTLQTVALSTANNSLTEGDTFNLRLEASRTMQPTPVEIELVNIEGDFIVESIQTISLAGNYAELEVATTDNETYEKDGVISATLLAGDGYVVDFELNQVEINVINDEQLPEISITSSTNELIEGETAVVTLHSEVVLDTEYFVLISIFNESGDYYKGPAIREISISPRYREVSFEIPTLANELFQNDGLIKIQVEEGNDYTKGGGTSYFQRILVKDDDRPEGIAILAKKDQVGTDQSTEIKLTSDVESVQDVKFTISKKNYAGTYVGESNHLVSFATGTSELVLDLKNYSRSLLQEPGRIAVTLSFQPHYVGSEYYSEAFIDIVENFAPKLSIVGINSTLQAGEPLRLKLRSAQESIQNVNLLIQSAPNQSSYEERRMHDVDFERGTSETTVALINWDNPYVQENGHVLVSILPRPHYTISDEFGSAQFEIIDDETPEISIWSQQTNVSEGEPIEVMLVSSIKMEKAFTVNLQYTDNDNILANEILTTEVQIPAGTNSVRLPHILTNNVSNLNVESNITIQVQSGDGYTIATEPSNKVTVQVTAAQQLQNGITISAISPEVVNEGDVIQFQISSPIYFNRDRKINLLIEESGEFLAVNQPNSIILNTNEREAILELTTLKDGDFNPQSQVKVTILAGELYTVANRPYNSAVVTIVDDDIPYGVSVISKSSSVMEGEEAIFQISISETYEQDLVIWYDLYYESKTTLSVIIPSGQNVAEIRVQTQENVEVKEETLVRLDLQRVSKLLPFAEYHKRAVVEVINNDLPAISVTSNSNITEGEDISFTITSTPVPISELEVKFAISSQGNFVRGDFPNLTALEAYLTSKTIRIPTFDDNLDEPDGEVELILLESTGYEIVPNQQSTLVEVSDNDEVTIELVGSGGTIQEGSQYTATIPN